MSSESKIGKIPVQVFSLECLPALVQPYSKDFSTIAKSENARYPHYPPFLEGVISSTSCYSFRQTVEKQRMELESWMDSFISMEWTANEFSRIILGIVCTIPTKNLV